MVDDPEPGASAAATVSPVVVASPEGVMASVAVEDGVPGAVDLTEPGVARADPAVLPPDEEPAPDPTDGPDPPELGELPGRTGLVLDGLLDGLGVEGLLDDEVGLGLGFGDGFGATAAGGALLGAPPDPKANPMTLPGAGSYSATPELL